MRRITVCVSRPMWLRWRSTWCGTYLLPPACPVRALIAAAVLMLVPACSLRTIAVNSVADTLARGGDTFAADPDPELIRDAVPFSLKLVESLLAEVPKHRGLLLTACSSFTQYAYAFVDGGRGNGEAGRLPASRTPAGPSAEDVPARA